MNLNSFFPARGQIIRVLWITVAWTIISIYQFFLVQGSMSQLGVDISRINPWVQFQANLITGLWAGILGGSVVVFVWERWLRIRPYGWTLRSIFITYIIIFIMVAIPTSSYYQSNRHDIPYFSLETLEHSLKIVFSWNTLVPFLFWLVVVLLTMITFIVNDKYGPGVFQKFLLGKYFNPTREQRVFMFLDLRSSTTIAERLGEEQYFRFLKEVYKTATPGILKFQGEIYQYVGDEIVVSWPLDSGIQNSNCLNAFMEIRELISNSKEYFLEEYNVCPEFKAGLHYGNVMAGEIGVVKRDIAFSGDVMNTTARIQGKCNELGVDILISEVLTQKLISSNGSFSAKEMGKMDLRGKKEKIALYTV